MHADIHNTQDVLMPAAFIGHGNPMNALEVNCYTTAWKAFGAATPLYRANTPYMAVIWHFEDLVKLPGGTR